MKIININWKQVNSLFHNYFNDEVFSHCVGCDRNYIAFETNGVQNIGSVRSQTEIAGKVWLWVISDIFFLTRNSFKITALNQFNVTNICGLSSMLPSGLRDKINIGYCSAQCIRQGKRFGYCNLDNVCQCVEVVDSTTTAAPEGTTVSSSATTASPVGSTSAAVNGAAGNETTPAGAGSSATPAPSP